jgi:PAS domain S-box-containing protein
MEKNKLDIQVLLEISLNQRLHGEIDAALDHVINLYMRKLNCFAAAIFTDTNIKLIKPHALSKSPQWDFKLASIAEKIKKHAQEAFHFAEEESHFYMIPLADYGWLVLVRKMEFSLEMLLELSKVVYQLGRDLSQLQEEDRLKLLQELFDNSSDAIHILEENGKFYYVNHEAAERMGINPNEIRNYSIGDIEFLKLWHSKEKGFGQLNLKNDEPNSSVEQNREISLKDSSEWEALIHEMEENGQLTIQGTNLNKATNNFFPVEITSKLIEIKSKRFIISFSRDITQRKKQEQILKNTTQKLESILNEMTDVVWSVSIPNYELIFVTPSVETLYELSVAQWMNDSSLWEKVIHEEDRGILSKIYSDLELKGEYSVTYRIVTPTGKVKWVRNKAKYIYDSDKQPVRLDGVVKDRTSQYHAQEILDQEIKLQEVLIDIASTYINLEPVEVENTINESLEKMGHFVSADRSYIFDYDFIEGTTSNTYEWCAEGIAAEIENLQDVPIDFLTQWLESHRRNEAFYVPNVSELEDDGEGGLRSVLEPQGIKSLIAIPMLDGKELIGFVGFDSVRKHHVYSDKEKRLLFLFGQMLINIRNRQKWEHQLRLQEEKYRNIIANMNLGLLEVDNDDVILYANQTFCDMSAYTLKELKGLNAANLFVSKEDRHIITDKNKQRRDSVSDSYEIQITNRNGEKRWWFISGAPNFNDKGQLIGSIGIHLDISDQKRLEQELAMAKSYAEAAAKAKELFLANMSHEIRTPLNGIIGMIRQLAKEKLNKEQHSYVKSAGSSAKHLLTILNDVLDIAKIESGDLEIVRSSFSPSALIYNVHSIMYSQAKEKNLEFKPFVSPEIKSVLIGDETRLRQVLINLIGNSIKFTQRGSINLNVEVLNSTDKEQRLRFEVIDTGIGMSEAFVSKIFDKFSQEQNSASRSFEGTGLGMAISRDLVQLMGGEIEVISALNEGTTCRFDLSFSIGTQDSLVSKSRQVKEGTFKGKKALLVEDNSMNRFIAKHSLNYLGIETIEAENGQIATEIVASQKFDLILMDIQMPVMDGVEATIYIRNILKIDTPIIALTANAFKHDIDLYLKSGMNDFITKPYYENDFFYKVEHVLNLSSPNQRT